MRWVIAALCVAVALFAWALCRAAGEADRREEEMMLSRRAPVSDDAEPA